MEISFELVSSLLAIVGVALIVALAVIRNLQKLVTESKELLETVQFALADGDVTSAELSKIFAQALDVAEVIRTITFKIIRARR